MSRLVIMASQAMWRALVAGTYFNDPQGQCGECLPGSKSCGNFFCVECEVGRVCEGAFLSGGNHAHHPSIQIWKVTYEEAICVADLRRFDMSHEQVNQIELYKQNERLHCKLARPRDANARAAGPSARGRRLCHGCGYPISRSSTPNNSASPVCSLTCLLDHALAERVNSLIAVIDTMPGEWDLVTANGNLAQ